MEENILNKIYLDLSFNKVKELAQLALSKDTIDDEIFDAIFPNTYLASKHIVNDEEEVIINDEDLILKFYQDHVNRLVEDKDNEFNGYGLELDKQRINNSLILKQPTSVEQLFNSYEFRTLNYWVVFPQEMKPNSNFIHFKGSHINNFSPMSIECRLYISPMMKNLVELSEEVINKHNEQEVPYYFKINTNQKENDRFVMYTNLDSIQKHLDILNEIRDSKPYLFNNMNKNPLWGNIEEHPDIYFGMNPVDNSTSYAFLRGLLFDNALYDLKQKYSHFNKTTELTDEMVIDLQDLFANRCLRNNINPTNVALNNDNYIYETNPKQYKKTKN